MPTYDEWYLVLVLVLPFIIIVYPLILTDDCPYKKYES
jgi:hypothetical protein